MTPQEQQMIDGLISRIRSTPVPNKDGEAEQHIQQGLAGVPDSLYVLVQTVLVQQYGLEQAQGQLNELKQQNQVLQSKLGEAQQASHSTGGSFLSHLFGGDRQNTTPASATSPQQAPYQPVNNPGYPAQGAPAGYPPPPVMPPQGYPQYPSQGYPGQGGGGLFGGGGGGFLQSAMQTAAGVAAGEMVFRGMEDLFGGFGRGGSERGFSGTGGGGETVVNNYYDDDRNASRSFDAGGDDTGRQDSSFYNPERDASRSDLGDASQGGGDTDRFSGGGADVGSDDLASSDDAQDDTSFTDNSGDDFSGGGDDFSGGSDDMS